MLSKRDKGAYKILGVYCVFKKNCATFLTPILFFPTLDIKSFYYSQILLFAKSKPLFLTSTFKWFLFFFWLIVSCNILNSTLIYMETRTKNWLSHLHKIKIIIGTCWDVLWNNFNMWRAIKTYQAPG